MLPVSLGEAIDKLTILDIKLAQINDARRNHVLVEYNLLREKLTDFLREQPQLYAQMKRVNQIIWDLMTPLRDHALDDHTYLQLAKKCIQLNDIRFRVKNKINTVASSNIKEQKGYSIQTLLIEIDNAVDRSTATSLVKYYALLWDQVVVVTSLSFDLSSDPNVIIKPARIGDEQYHKELKITSDYQIEDEKLFRELVTSDA